MKAMLLVCLAGSLAAAPLSQGERDRAVSDLHATRKLFLDSIAGLSEAQWRYKASPDRWSIAEVAEHIAIAETTVMGLIQDRFLKAPADPALKDRTKGKDEALMKAIRDRSQKATAPEMLKPVHQFADLAATEKAFREARDRNIQWVNSTQEDLRDHGSSHPVFKELDTYQWVLLVSGHCERHTMQILEVKADPNFPKK